MMLTLAAMLVVALSVTAATSFAANAPEGCHKERGTLICPQEAKNPNQDQEQTVTKKGSVNSSHDAESTCTNGAGGSGKCSPGQFKDQPSPL